MRRTRACGLTLRRTCGTWTWPAARLPKSAPASGRRRRQCAGTAPATGISSFALFPKTPNGLRLRGNGRQLERVNAATGAYIGRSGITGGETADIVESRALAAVEGGDAWLWTVANLYRIPRDTSASGLTAVLVGGHRLSGVTAAAWWPAAGAGNRLRRRAAVRLRRSDAGASAHQRTSARGHALAVCRGRQPVRAMRRRPGSLERARVSRQH